MNISRNIMQKSGVCVCVSRLVLHLHTFKNEIALIYRSFSLEKTMSRGYFIYRDEWIWLEAWQSGYSIYLFYHWLIYNYLFIIFNKSLFYHWLFRVIEYVFMLSFDCHRQNSSKSWNQSTGESRAAEVKRSNIQLPKSFDCVCVFFSFELPKIRLIFKMLNMICQPKNQRFVVNCIELGWGRHWRRLETW